MRRFLTYLAFGALLFINSTLSLHASEELKIRTQLSRFAILVDDDNFAPLDDIFTQDVFADYAGQQNHGLPAFTAFLKRDLGGRITQHAVSTTVIEDLGASLNSTAYVTAGFLGQGNKTGSVVTLYGKYLDTWVREGGREWKINRRNFVQFVSFETFFLLSCVCLRVCVCVFFFFFG